jgi:Tfp pilus assembly protein PilV
VSRHDKDTIVTFRTFFLDTARREDGLSLIEVVITAMLVGLISVGTLTGFQVIDRASADERFHDEAETLSAQSQEQLRSDPASTLNDLAGLAGASSEHSRTYIVKVDKTAYTITQEAQYVNESKPGSDCSAIGAGESSSKEDGDYLRVTSKVTWPELTADKTKREPVTESSIITPPDGSTLEIDATNGASPDLNLSGVKAVVKYTGVEAKEITPVEGTTGTAGCIVFGGIPATSAKVEIKELSGYVTQSGSLKEPAKEVTIAPNIATHDPVVLNEGGAITAKFTYNNNPVEGNTFVAFYGEAKNPANEFTVGAHEIKYEPSGEKKYRTVTAESSYSNSASTPIELASYPKGDLFPFPQTAEHPAKWQVFAGDCEANNANAIDSAVKNGEATVLPGKAAEVSVPMVNLTVDAYTGTKGSTTAESKLPIIKITNTACESAPTPINAYESNLVHEQTLNATGNLKHQYQPFGKEKLCLVGETTTKKSGGKTTTEYHTQTVEPNLSTTSHTDIFYLGETANYTPTGGDAVKVETNTTKPMSC